MNISKNNAVYVPLQPYTDNESDDDFPRETTSLFQSEREDKKFLDFDEISHMDGSKLSKILMIIKGFSISKFLYILKDFKTGFVFVLLVIMTLLIAVNPVYPVNFQQYGVSTDFTSLVTINKIPVATSALRVKLRGSLMFTPYGKYANVTLLIQDNDCIRESRNSSSLSHCIETWTVPVYQDKFPISESIQTKYFVVYKKKQMNQNRNIEIKIQSKSTEPVPIGMSYAFLTHSVGNQVIYGAFILLSVYIFIIFDLVHRTVAAILGSLATIAVLSSFSLKPSLETVISWLDFDTLTLLFGMMLTVGIFSETGFFDWVAFKSYELARGRRWPLLIILCTFASLISAFLDNVTTVLLLTPVSIRLCEAMKIDPKKILIAEVIFSNIGGTATAIGDPPNVIIVSSNELKEVGVNFTNFTLHMSIGTVFIFFFSLVFLRLIYGDLGSEGLAGDEAYRIVELKREIEVWRRSAYAITIASQEEATVRALLLEKVVQLEHELGVKKHLRRPSARFRETVKDMRDKYIIKDKWLLVKCSFILTVIIISFFLSSILEGFYLDLGWISLFGAVWIIVLSDFANFEAVVEKVEWSTLIFFAALFALMKALEELSLISFIGQEISNLMLQVPSEYRLMVTIIVIVWLSAISSSFIDNIPFTTAMIPIILKLSDHMPILPLVWALAFGACLGGNGTLIGASANVVVAGVAQQHGYSFSFIEFFKIGFPVMIFSTTFAMIYLLICHVIIGWNYS